MWLSMILLAVAGIAVLDSMMVKDSASGAEDEGDDTPQTEPNVSVSDDFLNWAAMDPDEMPEDPNVRGDSEENDVAETAPEDGAAVPDKAPAPDAPGLTLSGVSVHTDVASGITSLHSGSQDILNGSDGDDLIALGRFDIATGGGGHDTFLVDGSIAWDGPVALGELPVITDFDPSCDRLIISIPTPVEKLAETWPERPVAEGTITTELVDGQTHVLLDNQVVCILSGDLAEGDLPISVIYDYHAGLPTDFDITYGYAQPPR